MRALVYWVTTVSHCLKRRHTQKLYNNKCSSQYQKREKGIIFQCLVDLILLLSVKRKKLPTSAHFSRSILIERPKYPVMIHMVFYKMVQLQKIRFKTVRYIMVHHKTVCYKTIKRYKTTCGSKQYIIKWYGYKMLHVTKRCTVAKWYTV